MGHAHEVASLVGRCCPALVAAVDEPWKVTLIGLLFGLGLDTATEIALLTLTALAQPGVPPWGALVLPLLFAAGMALVDSLNGLLMLWAYEWAAENGPMHRLYFSYFLTVASAVLALAIGAVEALGQLAALQPKAGRGGGFWGAMVWTNDRLEVVGLATVGAFLAAIVAAVVLAPRCVPTQTEVREQERAKLDRQLGDYLKRGEYIVRVEI